MKKLFTIVLIIISASRAHAQKGGVSFPWGYYISGPTIVNSNSTTIWPDTASVAFQVGKDTTTKGLRGPWVVDTSRVPFPRKYGLEINTIVDTMHCIWLGTRWQRQKLTLTYATAADLLPYIPYTDTLPRLITTKKYVDSIALLKLNKSDSLTGYATQNDLLNYLPASDTIDRTIVTKKYADSLNLFGSGYINITAYNVRSANTPTQNSVALGLALNTGRNIYIPPGLSHLNFDGSSFTLAVGQIVFGSGDSTTLLVDTNNAPLFVCANYSQVRYTAFQGAGKTASKPKNGLVHIPANVGGVKIIGNTGYQVNGDTSTGNTLAAWNGGGFISAWSAGGSFNANLTSQIIENACYTCKTFINMGHRSEFIRIINNVSRFTTYGCFAMSGNLTIADNDFSVCTIPIYRYPGENGGHATITDNIFNHSFRTIFDYSGSTPGDIIKGCMFYGNDSIYIKGSTDTKFDNCHFDKAGAFYTILDSNVYLLFDKCKFPNARNSRTILRSGKGIVFINRDNTDYPRPISSNFAYNGFIFGSGNDTALSNPIVIDSAGQLGIGTSNPSSIVNVFTNVVGITAFKIGNYNTAGAGGYQITNGTDTAGLYYGGSTYSIAAMQNRFGLFSPGASAGIFLIAHSIGDIKMYTGGFNSTAEQFRISNSGRTIFGQGSLVDDGLNKVQVYGKLGVKDSVALFAPLKSSLAGTDSFYTKNAGRLSITPFSSLTTLFNSSYIQNQQSSAQAASDYINGFDNVIASATNTTLAAAAATNPFGLNARSLSQLTITDGSGTTSNAFNASRYSRLTISGVPNMVTNSSGSETYGSYTELLIQNSTYSSINTSFIPSANRFHLGFNNAVATNVDGLYFTANYGGTNTLGTVMRVHLPTHTGTSVPTDMIGFAADDASERHYSFGPWNIGGGSSITSAILALTSTTKGFGLPSMTSTQRAAISSPTNGLQIYETTTNRPYYYKSTFWTPLFDSVAAAAKADTSLGKFTNYYSVSASPGIVAGTGAGTSPTISISGTNSRVKVTLTVGTAPATSATIATITFSNSFAYPLDCKPSITPGNDVAATLSGATAIYCVGSTSSFTINSNTLALAAGTYIWYITTGN